MYRQSEAMKELHKIREQMYEESKCMTNKQFIEYIHKASKNAKRKYGLNFRKAASVKQ